MIPRRVAALADLEDADLFARVSEGLALIAEAANTIYASAKALSIQEHGRGSNILLGVAKEEASKYLILLDAIRCPRSPKQSLQKHLKRFSHHLARGIYAEASWWRVGTFGQLRKYVDMERADFFLDGPNDVDWIFRNEITREREEALYVDYEIGRASCRERV